MEVWDGWVRRNISQHPELLQTQKPPHTALFRVHEVVDMSL
jgi:hypothetical protein